MCGSDGDDSTGEAGASALDVVETIILALIEKGLVEPDALHVVLEELLDEYRLLSRAPHLNREEQRMHAGICAVVESLLRGTNLHAARR